MFGGVTDDGDDDDADEDAGHAEALSGVFDGADEDLANPGDERGGAGEDGDGLADAPGLSLSADGLAALAAEELLVGNQGEDQTESIDNEQNDGNFHAQRAFAGCARGSGEIVICRGEDERNGGEEEHGRLILGGHAVKGLRLVPDAAHEHGKAADEQDVANNGSGEGGFDNVVKAAAEGCDGNDHLGGITEGGVEEAADGFSGVMGEIFRCFTKPSGKRKNSDASTKERLRMGVWLREMEPDGNWHKY